MAKQSQQLATKSSQHVATMDESVFDTGRAEGLENVTARDLLIPRLTILQALSPQLVKSKPEFIKGASAGMFCDVGSQQVFDGTLHLLPCYYAMVLLEWKQQRGPGSFVANHGMDRSILANCTPDEKGRNILPNGNYIAETATYMVLNLSAKGRRSFLPMASTQLKASRRWMNAITAQRIARKDGSEYQPPLYYRSWLADVVEQSNEQGAWFGWKFEPGPTVLELDASGALLKEAKDFYQQASQGLVTGDVAAAAEEHATTQGQATGQETF